MKLERMIAFMILYLLVATSVGTLILNLLLTKYLLKNKLAAYFPNVDNNETISFVLTPPTQIENTADTEVFATEIIATGDN